MSTAAVAVTSRTILTPTAAKTAFDLAPDDDVIRALDAARRNLPSVQSLAEAIARRDLAAAIQKLLRRRNRSRGVQNAAALLAFATERQCAELRNQSPPPRRGRPPKSFHRETISSSDIAVSALERHRWRKLLKITVEELEAMEAECTANGREFTRAYVWRQLISMFGEDESDKLWEDWADREEQEKCHDALNTLHGWLAPFTRGGKTEDVIASVMHDGAYLSAHDKALLSDRARDAIGLLTPLLDMGAA